VIAVTFNLEIEKKEKEFILSGEGC
jgi:hypothetical protein